MYIFGSVDSGYIIDHINQDKLDNRRANLRMNSSSGNCHNQAKPKGATSEYKGVHKKMSKWLAVISKDNKKYTLGIYSDETMAAIAYNIKAKELYKDCANLNSISEEDYNKNINEVIKIMNDIKRKDSTSASSSKYHGVNFKCGKWRVIITKNKVKYFLGVYGCESEAGIAFNIKSYVLNGERAKLNDISHEDNLKYYDSVNENLRKLNMI